MTARELPPAEWHRLEGTELGPARDVLSPAWCRVLVVEDDHGQIIGCWSLQSLLHVEGVWIHPDHRTKGGVARALLRTMRGWVRDAGGTGVLSGALTTEIGSLLESLGAFKLPGTAYAWPIIRKEST